MLCAELVATEASKIASATKVFMLDLPQWSVLTMGGS
jgi:hypothetical protein